jgi:plasmid stabilization system protein ParE
VRIRLTPDAVAQIAAVDAWWRENRLAAPDLFADELAHGMALLGSLPYAGRPLRRPGTKGVRMLLLRATRYHLFYAVSAEEIQVLSVWSAVRRSRPNLQQP